MSNRLSATIQSIMDAKGYSARELARLLGWSPSTLSKKLSGDLKIRRSDREQIAAVLGTTADAIVQLGLASVVVMASWWVIAESGWPVLARVPAWLGMGGGLIVGWKLTAFAFCTIREILSR